MRSRLPQASCGSPSRRRRRVRRPTGGVAHLTSQYDIAALDPALAIQPADPIRDLREPGHVSRQAGTRRIAHRPRGRRSRADAHGRREDLHVHDSSRLPVLAAVERGGDGADVQVDDRARGEPAPEVAIREPVQRRRRATTTYVTRQGARARGHRRARATRSRSGCRSRTARSSPTSRAARRARSRATRRPSPADSTSSRLRARTTSRRTRRASSSSSGGTRTTTASARTVSTRSSVTIGIDSSRALAEIKAGTADYALDGLPRDAGPGLESRYGPGSKAAKEGHQQYFISPANGERWLHMNTSRPLFSRIRLRRAVNYAIDRAALVAQGRRFAEVNPFNAGEPTDDYLPRVGRRSGRLPSVPAGRARPPNCARPRRARPRDGDHVHTQRAAVAAGGAGRPPRPRATRHRRRGEGVPARRFLRAHRPSRRAVRPRRLGLLTSH